MLKAMAKRNLLYLDFGGFRIDLEGSQLYSNGEAVVLTHKCFELLKFLVVNRDRILRKKEILGSVWAGTFVSESTLTQHMYMLRKAMRCDRETDFPIETVPKMGYRFKGNVGEVFEEDLDNSFPPERAAPAEFLDQQSAAVGAESDSARLAAVKRLSPFATKMRRALMLATSVASILLIAELLYFQNRSTVTAERPNKLAVLPFRDLSTGAIDQSLGTGLADLVVSRLGRIENLRISPMRDAIQVSERNDLDIFEVSEQLNADAILLGTIQRDRDIVRVNLQIFCARSKKMLVSETLDGNATELFAMQDAISQKVVSLLSPTIRNEIEKMDLPTTSDDRNR